MAKLSEELWIPIIIHDDFILALFDKSLSKQKLDMAKQWQHLKDAGYMIDRLYTLSKNGNVEAKNILNLFVDKIEEQSNMLDLIIDEFWSDKEKPIRFKKDVGKQAFVFWDNKMFLTLSGLVEKLDQFSCEIKELKRAEVITNKVFRAYQHKATGRLRSILNFIYSTSKKNKETLYPPKPDS